ncbi:MAG: hypothetical protein ACM32H_09120, partial [Candidatus Aminicenantes bacterium RBG_16_66_30]
MTRIAARRPSAPLFALFVSLGALAAYLTLSPSGTISAAGAAKAGAARPTADGAKAFAHVAFLASDDFKGRKAGTP